MPRFIWPVPQPHSQRFGDDFRTDSGEWYYKQYLSRLTGQRYEGHNGDDLASPAGTPVKAAADGTVEFEGRGQDHGWMGSPAGICVLLKHSDCYTGYAHLSQTIVNKGQSVRKGEVIGYSGSTGAATGPHLHFEFLPLSPDFNNGYAGRVNPANFDIGTEEPPRPAPPQFIPMDVPRVMLASTGLHKFDPDAKAFSHEVTLQKGDYRLFVDKVLVDDRWYLRTEHDKKHNNRRGFALENLIELPDPSEVVKRLKSL